MCLVLFALNEHAEYKLVLAANRDEFYSRKSLAAHHWKENRNVIGGKDAVSKGTWMGLNSNGRFIAITNYRDPSRENKNAKSRGLISRNFLINSDRIKDFTFNISGEKENYNGFNLLLSDDGFNSIIHYSNISDETTILKSGVHGLSNALLNTPWPKVVWGIKKLSELINGHAFNTTHLIELLNNSRMSTDDQLPDTGISLELEQKLSPVFISMNGYGTRCSTALLVDRNNLVTLHEVTYNQEKQVTHTSELQLELKY